MTHEDRVLALFATANPVPEPNALLSTLQEPPKVGTSDQVELMMAETRSRIPTTAPPVRHRRPWLLATAVAFVVIVVIGGFSYLFATPTAQEVVDPAPTTTTIAEIGPADPLSIAEAFIAARNAYDSDAIEALLAPNADITDWRAETEGYEAMLSLLAAEQARVVEHTCFVPDNGAEGAVVCRYSYSNAWSEALDVGPFGGHTLRFEIEDGHITVVAHGFADIDFALHAWTVFRRWISENHPQDLPVLYVDEYDYRYTEEAAALLAQRTTEFVEDIASG